MRGRGRLTSRLATSITSAAAWAWKAGSAKSCSSSCQKDPRRADQVRVKRVREELIKFVSKGSAKSGSSSCQKGLRRAAQVRLQRVREEQPASP